MHAFRVHVRRVCSGASEARLRYPRHLMTRGSRAEFRWESAPDHLPLSSMRCCCIRSLLATGGVPCMRPVYALLGLGFVLIVSLRVGRSWKVWVEEICPEVGGSVE